MLEPIYFASGHVESTWLWDDNSHAEDEAHVKVLGAYAWGPIEEDDHE